MLDPRWQDLLRQFKEGYASYDPLCFFLVMIRFVPGEDGRRQFPPDLGMELLAPAGCVTVIEPPDQRVFLAFEIIGRAGRLKSLVLSGDGCGGIHEKSVELDPDPTQPCDNPQEAASVFLRLARTGGAMLSDQQLASMGVIGQHQPEALWALFLFQGLQETPGEFIFEHGEGQSHVTVLRSPFAASSRALEADLMQEQPAYDPDAYMPVKEALEAWGDGRDYYAFNKAKKANPWIRFDPKAPKSRPRVHRGDWAKFIKGPSNVRTFELLD